ncbi:MAG: sulfurtransferase [Steroidobacteraceae bacterium]
MMLFAAAMFAATTYARPEMLVSTEWLAAHLNDSDIRIVDMRRAASDYEGGHLPNAVYLANDDIRNPKAAPTFLPTQAEFESLMERLGIGNKTRVIAYDDRGGLYAARLWWILNHFGHSNAALLDGGWVKWTQERRATASAAPKPAQVAFRATPNPRWVATADDVKSRIGQKGVRILDARTQAEIEGKDLRGIKRGGYIASSTPLYWEDLLDPTTKAFKPAAELDRLFTERRLTPSDEIITYCQVGMRASVDLFALHLMGYDKLRNYYGAWEEWGNRDDTPIETRKR